MTIIYTVKKLIMVLVDADYFIGLYYIDDPHHQRCLSIAESLTEDLVTTYDVIDEVVTKLTYFKRKDKALLFLNDIKRTNFVVIFPNPKLFTEAEKIFKNQKSSHVSFTDCMNMAIAKEKKVKFLLSFDKIYEKNGFKLIK